MKNVKFTKLKEAMKGEKCYVLFKVSLENKSGYCIAVRDDEFCVQGLGNDADKASEIFDLLLCGEVSAIHINDVIRDMQNEIFI